MRYLHNRGHSVIRRQRLVRVLKDKCLMPQIASRLRRPINSKRAEPNTCRAWRTRGLGEETDPVLRPDPAITACKGHSNPIQRNVQGLCCNQTLDDLSPY